MPFRVANGVDHRPRIGTVGRRLGDRPDRVAGLHDDHLLPPPSRLHLRARCLPVTPERPGDRSGKDDRQGHAPERGGDPAATANTCSTHGSMVAEHVFGVKGSLEHMFASSPGRC